MVNLQNLQPWPKGISGNPKGRPKGARNRKSIYKELLELPPTFTLERIAAPIFHQLHAQNIAEQIAITLIIKALDGNGKACEKVMDYAYGKD